MNIFSFRSHFYSVYKYTCVFFVFNSNDPLTVFTSLLTIARYFLIPSKPSFSKSRLYLSLLLIYSLIRGSLISMAVKLSPRTPLPNHLYLTWSRCCLLHSLLEDSESGREHSLLGLPRLFPLCCDDILSLSIPYVLVFPEILSPCWFALCYIHPP